MEIVQKILKGERALYAVDDADVRDCIFEDGESPLKESKNVTVRDSLFKWRYPIWYCENVSVDSCSFFENARAGMWYVDGLSVENSAILAPKCLRRCHDLTLRNVTLPAANETLWACEHVTLENVAVRGEYFAMNSSDLKITGLTLDGKYSFDGVKNVEIRDSKLLTKDAFWNAENVTAINCLISGEYIGWNSKNITLIDCTVESLQGLCYVENLVMKNCKLLDTTLAFEYSTVDAELTTRVESVFNPKAGRISAPEIGELIVENDRVDASATEIDCKTVEKRSDRPEWLR